MRERRGECERERESGPEWVFESVFGELFSIRKRERPWKISVSGCVQVHKRVRACGWV